MNESAVTTCAARQVASEEDLACRAQAGCQDSFNELAKRLQPRLLFLLRRRMQNESDAEDIAQKTLLRAYEKIHLYNTSRKFSPWLFTIAIRLATDHYRLRRLPTDPTGDAAATVIDPAPAPDQKAISSEHSADIWELAQRLLKPDQWTALWLLYGEGQSTREIATTLNRTTVSIRVLLYRARKTLTPHLKAYMETADQQQEEFIAPALQVVRAES